MSNIISSGSKIVATVSGMAINGIVKNVDWNTDIMNNYVTSDSAYNRMEGRVSLEITILVLPDSVASLLNFVPIEERKEILSLAGKRKISLE